MDTKANVASVTPLPGASAPRPTTPDAGATNKSFASSGSATDPNGANATITPSSLSSGQVGPGSSSGMSFIAPPHQDGPGAIASASFGSHSGHDPASGSHGDPSFGSDGGNVAWLADYNDQPVVPVYSIAYDDQPVVPAYSIDYNDQPVVPAYSIGYNDQPVAPAYGIIVLP
jgi:hypothetical protein